MNKKNTTLVLGASLKPERYSNKAMNSLHKHGHSVKAIGLRDGNVAGIDIDTEPKNYDDIETVTLYLNPKRQEEYYTYIISLRPNRVLFNPGTENQKFKKMLEEAGIKTEEACTLVLLATNQYEA